MNRRDLVRAIAAHTDDEVKNVDTFVQGFTDVVTHAVSKGENVAISGFAKFAKVERNARWGRNPATGERIRIKASKRARITPLKGLKEAVSSPGSAPRLGKGVLDGSALATRAAKKASAKKSTAKKRATAKRAGTTRRKATGRKSTARKSTARKSTARKSTARKSTARKSSARKSARRSPARRR